MMYLIRGDYVSKELNEILKIEDELGYLFEDKELINDNEAKKIGDKLLSLLKKLNNDELLYLLDNVIYIHQVVDITRFFKKYKINKKEIKENNAFKKVFKKLNLFVERVREISLSEEEYMFICSKCSVDDTAKYLLKNMSNEDIMELSNETGDWNYKLFLFENLKA